MKKATVAVLFVFISSALLNVSCSQDVEKSVTKFSNPITTNQADPWVYHHTDGYYYYSATESSFKTVVIRRAKSLDLLKYASEKTIAAASGESVTGALILTGSAYYRVWAPELHYIDGAWYVFFTASENSGGWAQRQYVLKCSDENPLTGSWSLVGKIKAVTGSTFDETDNIMTTFNLDGTAFKVGDQWYYAWAQYVYCDGAFDEVSGDTSLTVNGKAYANGALANGWSVIFIGKTSPDDFTKVTNATILTVPQYAWEYGGDTSICTHTSANVNVNEGPAILQRNGKVFIVYSASACDESYCLGMLSADQSADLCAMSSWTKSATPVFTTSVAHSVYGPGHCSFTTVDGDDVIVYHARTYPGLYTSYKTSSATTDGLSDPFRSARAKVFTWNTDGTPHFGEAE